jgi:hypothetical protein
MGCSHLSADLLLAFVLLHVLFEQLVGRILANHLGHGCDVGVFIDEVVVVVLLLMLLQI